MAVIFFNRETKNPENNQVEYQGHQLDRDKKPYVAPAKDLTNYPSTLKIGGILLPPDVVVYLSGSKTLAVTKILDGVQVTERIMRNAYELEFECTMRQKNNTSPWDGGYVFPQDDFYNIWANVWLPDSVQKIENTYLNKLGIQEIIIESIQPETIRGSKNLPFRIKAWENVPGQSLIVT